MASANIFAGCRRQYLGAGTAERDNDFDRAVAVPAGMDARGQPNCCFGWVGNWHCSCNGYIPVLKDGEVRWYLVAEE